VEGEYVLVAPIETAHIISVTVKRGDRFSAHQPLVILEKRDSEIAVLEAKAALAHVQSQFADLLIGERPEEIAVIQASLDFAQAKAIDARRTLGRQADLLRRRATPRAAYDTAATAVSQAEATVAQTQAVLAVANLPARPEAIKAAEASVEQAKAILGNAEWRLSQRTLSVPEAGIVSDIIRHPGEVASPQEPVISVLPDEAVKVRIFVPEKSLSAISPGTVLSVLCDGCGTGMTATVSYVATDPEFTPPVLYSLENRQKLVYMVEATPDRDAISLKPGQIVDVQIGDQAQ
jgi:HlyD family secretion protein